MFSSQTLRAQLPCAIDAYDCINTIFARWHQHNAPSDKFVIDLWVYAFAAQHIQFQYKNVRLPKEDLDQLVSEIYLRVHTDLRKIKNPRRFTMWVTTICRRAVLNLIRNARTTEPLDEESFITPASDADQTLQNQMIMDSLNGAIDNLPQSLQNPARLRYVYDFSPAEIADITNCPPARTHAYLGKIKTRLQKHTDLRDCMFA